MIPVEQSVAAQERANLTEALIAPRSGPPHPAARAGPTTTWCAHLIVREHQPLAGLGIAVKPLASWHDGAITRAKAKTSFEERVERFRNGPPLLWKPIDSLFNGQEYFVHHEDVRRGDGRTGPRPVDEVGDIEAALWSTTRKGARFAVRGLKGIGVDLVDPDGDTIHARTGDDVVSIIGRPGEIVLYLAGRRSAADVRLEGSAHAVEVAEQANLGI